MAATVNGATPTAQQKQDLATAFDLARVAKDPNTGAVTGLVGPDGGIVKTFHASLPSLIAHRGAGALVAPENTLSAYRCGMVNDLKNIEMDCNILSDGAIGCMHDTTVDRTTSGTGNCTAFSATTFKALSVDSSSWFAPAWPSESPPLFDEALALLFDSGVTIWPEAKGTGAGAAIVARLIRYNWPQDRAVVQSFTQAELLPAIRAGYPALFLANSVGADFAVLRAFGLTWHGANDWTLETVAAAKAAGITPVYYTLSRKVDLATQQALGLEYFFSDDPLWTGGGRLVNKSDPYRMQTWASGMFADKTERGKFLGSKYWGWDTNTGGFQSVLQGWGCPINDDPAQMAFSMSLTLAITSVTAADRWAGILVGADSDAKYEDLTTGNAVGGYHILIRQNGTVQIYRAGTTGSSTKIGETIGTALTLSTEYVVNIAVTASSITVEIPALGTTVSANDTTFRGGYFHFGKNGAACTFSDVVVSA